MRTLDGEGTLVRVFIGESDQWRHQPLALALVERLRREGFSGATVFRGIAGFGARSVLHTTQILRLSEDLPVLIRSWSPTTASSRSSPSSTRWSPRGWSPWRRCGS